MKTLLLIGMLAMMGCKQGPVQLTQKLNAEIIAVFQIPPSGAWATSVKYEDGSRSVWTNYKLGEPGEKFVIWRRGNVEFLQNPN